MIKKLILFFLLTFLLFNSKGQSVGDFGAITSGTWTTTTIWRQWNGTAWVTVPAVFPSGSSVNVWILNGSTVTVNGAGPYSIGSLYVQTGAKLYANTTAQVYLSVWGNNIVCDGEIGNTTSYDGLSFNIEAPNCIASGTGTFTASRIRKSANINPTTTLVIAMNIALRWSVSSATAIYNNVTAGNSRFDVRVNQGCTLNVAGSPTFPANLSVDGVSGSGGVGVYDAAGTYTIDGTLIVAGIIYATTDNTTAGYNAAFIITGTGVIKANQINSPNSGTSGMIFNVLPGGKLELTGPNGFYVTGATWGTTNNSYSFLPGSTVEYSATSNQSVLARSNFNSSTSPNNDYWNLITSGSGTKTILTNFLLNVRGNLNILSPTILNQSTNNPDILIGGNWINWGQGGFSESINVTKKVWFQGTGTAPGIPQQTITCPGGEVFYNLWIAKQLSVFNTVKLLSSITVTNNLQLGITTTATNYYGILELDTNSLTLEKPNVNAITLFGAGNKNRFIISEDIGNRAFVNWKINSNVGTYVIPFGISNTKDTIPFCFKKISTDSIGYLSVSTYGTPSNNLPWPISPYVVTNLNGIYNPTPDNRDYTVDRFWYVGGNTTNQNDSLVFSYNNTELPSLELNPGNLSAQYWDELRQSWDYPQQIGAASSYSTYSVTTPSNIKNKIWTLSSNASPLPVELLEFTGKLTDKGVELKWITASETNNDHFEIFKSFNAAEYSLMNSVRGQGTTNTTTIYKIYDDEPCNDYVYYKISQVDYDGITKEYSPIVVDCRGNIQHKPYKFVNILGQEIGDDYDGMKFIIYE